MGARLDPLLARSRGQKDSALGASGEAPFHVKRAARAGDGYDEARAVAYEQMAWWIDQGITAREAIEALTGECPRYAMWQTVEHLLVSCWMRQTLRADLKPFKRGQLPAAHAA